MSSRTARRNASLGVLGWDVNWSPDGSKIAYSRFVGTPAGNEELFVANADGTGETD